MGFYLSFKKEIKVGNQPPNKPHQGDGTRTWVTFSALVVTASCVKLQT